MTQAEQTQCHSPSSSASPEISILAEKARNGDGTAFGELVGLFQKEIFRMVYCRTRSQMDAEDLTQEIFLQAFKNLPSLNALERFRPWLYSIAVNRVRDYHRKKRFLSLFGGTGEEEDFETPDSEVHCNPGALDHLLKREFWKQIKKLSAQCSHWEREIFFLRFMDQLSIKEIAQVLGKSESAVKTHLYRALKKFREDEGLRELIEGENHDG